MPRLSRGAYNDCSPLAIAKPFFSRETPLLACSSYVSIQMENYLFSNIPSQHFLLNLRLKDGLFNRCCQNLPEIVSGCLSPRSKRFRGVSPEYFPLWFQGAMCYLPKILLLLFLTNVVCDATIHFSHTHQAPPRSISDSSFASTLNNSAISQALKTNHSSYNTSTMNSSYEDSLSTNKSFHLPAPFYHDDRRGRRLRNYQHIMSGFCDLGDSYCSLKNNDGTKRTATPTSVKDMCVLWDSSCSGDRTMAIKKFFRSTVDLGSNNCFEHASSGDSSACLKWNPPARLQEWRKIKDWMSSPQCASALDTYYELSGKSNRAAQRFDPSVSTCCLRCYIHAEDVDIYYWPDPDADTSCLSIIGGSVRPLDFGATKSTVSVLHELTQRVDVVTYWGCTAKTMKTGTLSDNGHLTTFADRETTLTAKITTIGSLSVKISVFNPWSSGPCSQEETASQVASPKTERRAPDHSLVVPPSITQKNDLPVTTVLDGFTL